MLADTIESSLPDRANRAWTTLTSFTLQAAIALLFVILPLLQPGGFPSVHPLTTPISFSRLVTNAPVIQSHARPGLAPVTPSTFFLSRSSALSKLPTGDAIAAPDISASGPYIPGLPTGDLHGPSFTVTGGTQPTLAAAPLVSISRPVRLSHMSEGDLIRKIQPAYPALARSARVQGMVVL